MRRPGRHPLATRAAPAAVGLAASCILLVGSLASIAGVRAAARAAIDREVRGNLARLASAVAATIDAESHARLTDPAQEGTPAYRRLNRALEAVVQRTDGVRYAYTLRPSHGRLHFVLDGTPPGDADHDGVEDHSFLMDEYRNPDPAAWDAARTGSVTVTAQPFTDAWGTFLSGFAPVVTRDGAVEAVVGVDASVGDYLDRLAGVDRAARRGLTPCVVISTAAGVLAWWVARRMARHARELDAHRRAAEAANRHKSVLLANISHELRTPLTAILGFVDVATDPAARPAERTEAIATVRDNADHLLALINDLLDMSKAEAGTIVIEPAEMDLHELFRTVAAPLAQRARAKGVELRLEGVDRLPRRVVMDPTRVRQILLNLIGNAVKFTDRGSVLVAARTASGALVVRVEDTGPGMDAGQVARLFRPFSQVGEDGATRRDGAGLGLAISRHLARLMGGSIGVESSPGRGSVFTAVLPYAEAPAKPGGPANADAPGLPGPLAGRRVLVAEDGADNRRLLRFILERAGAEVEEHADGRDALDAMLRPGPPVDLVLTDWDMPRLDGAGLVAGLRAAGWHGPVVSLTAHAMREQQAACERAGCDAHLTKPVDRATLVDTCARLLLAPRRRAG